MANLQQEMIDAIVRWQAGKGEHGADLLGTIGEDAWRLLCEAFSDGATFGAEQVRDAYAARYGDIGDPVTPGPDERIMFAMRRDTALMLLGWIQAHRPTGDWEPTFLANAIGILEKSAGK